VVESPLALEVVGERVEGETTPPSTSLGVIEMQPSGRFGSEVSE
jgi:hypothetical protein